MYDPNDVDRRIKAAGNNVRAVAAVFYQAREQLHNEDPELVGPPSIGHARSAAECYIDGARRMGWLP